MRIRNVLIAVAVLALAVPGMASAGSRTDRATGGGQILVSTDGGAGSTIAFTAQGTPVAAKGQVQFIDRTAGTGQSQVKYHGIVECILVNGNTAEIAGHERGSATPFTLRVVDNGEGAGANDMIFFDDVADDRRCATDDNDDEDATVALARGNAQVYDSTP